MKPFILVGAQRPASDPESDGPRNLMDAIRVAIAPEAANKGVLVVMNGQINAARDVTKTNTSQVETFRSLDFGQLGLVDVEKVRFYRAPVRRSDSELGFQNIPKLSLGEYNRNELRWRKRTSDSTNTS